MAAAERVERASYRCSAAGTPCSRLPSGSSPRRAPGAPNVSLACGWSGCTAPLLHGCENRRTGWAPFLAPVVSPACSVASSGLALVVAWCAVVVAERAVRGVGVTVAAVLPGARARIALGLLPADRAPPESPQPRAPAQSTHVARSRRSRGHPALAEHCSSFVALRRGRRRVIRRLPPHAGHLDQCLNVCWIA